LTILYIYSSFPFFWFAKLIEAQHRRLHSYASNGFKKIATFHVAEHKTSKSVCLQLNFSSTNNKHGFSNRSKWFFSVRSQKNSPRQELPDHAKLFK
jgi:hypothetical protein